LDYVKEVLFPRLETLKHKFLKAHPDEPFIFHPKEIRNAKPPFEILPDQKIRIKFDKEILFLLEELK